MMFKNFLILGLLFSACSNQHSVDGKSEFIGIFDTAMNDSSAFEGHVYQIDYKGQYPYKDLPFEIWIENSNYRVQTDSMGNYFIKTVPGTYTIKCQSGTESWAGLIEGVNHIVIGKNEKARINFYIGYSIE